MRKRSNPRELRAAKPEEQTRLFSEIIYPYLKDYRMMNDQEFVGYIQLLFSADPRESDKIWKHLLGIYEYTRRAVKKYKRKKGEFPEGMEGMDW